jgi:WD40 repeat protein
MKSPFKFLDSYTKDDREVFFGRDREIGELYQKVFDSKLLLVYGVSGTGKSSLIHCGLANKFQETDWLPLIIRRSGDIVESMAAVVNSASLTAQQNKFTTPSDFKKGVRSLYLDHYKPVYFIFDQFEELFIFGSKEERKSFIQITKSLIESDLQCRFIFVMREEYMAGITEFERYIPTFFSNRVRIEKMSHINAIEAIEKPCKVFGISLEEGFAVSLLDKLSPGSADVELTYLQVFLDKIYRIAQNEKAAETDQKSLSFTIPLLQKVGNVSDLLGSFLDEQISLLSDPETSTAVLKSFVSVKGTKRQMTSDEVKEYTQTLGRPIEESSLPEMLQTLINLRIIRDKDENEKYELRHDALAAKIYEKITLVEKEILEIRQFIENAWNSWQKRKVFLSKDDLDYIAPYESRLYLSKDHSGLIENSKKEIAKARRRKRNVLTAAALCLILVLSGFTIWALKERNNSIIKEKQARANNFNYLSKEVSLKDPTMGLQIAQFAYKLDPENKSILENLTRIYYDNSFYYKAIGENPSILSVAIAPDGKTFVIGCRDKTARVIDANGNHIQILPFDGCDIRTVAYSPDGKTILTGDGCGSVKLWNSQGNPVEIFRSKEETSLNSAMFSPDGKSIAIAVGKTAVLMDLNGNIQNIFRGHSENIVSIKFSPDGLKILTGSYDRTARLWDRKGKVLQVFKGNTGGILSVAFSPDGRNILTGSNDNNAKLWDKDGNELQIFKGHGDVIRSVEFSPDGNTVITGSGDQTARLWNLYGNPLQIFKGHAGEVIAKYFPDGKTILTASTDKSVKLWTIQNNTLQIFKGHGSGVSSVAFSNNGKTILTGSVDGTARLWNQDGNLIQILSDTTPILSAAFSPDENSVLTGSNDNIAKLWDLHGKVIKKLSGHNSSIYAVAFSPDARTILTGSYDRTARLWDSDGKTLQILRGHTSTVMSVAYSPDSKYILTGSRDYTAILWDLNGNNLQIFQGHKDRVTSVKFSPDGKTVLTGSQDNTARLWDLHGKLLQVFKGHEDIINSVAFSKNGKYILTGSRDKTARLWNLSGENLEIYDKNKSFVNSVAFSPDDRSVILGYSDGTARIYSIKIPFDEFIKDPAIEKLATGVQISYGMVGYEEIIKSDDPRQLNEAIDYYVSEAKMQSDLSLKSPVINIIYNLLKKVKLLNISTENSLGFIENCFWLYNIKPDRTLRDFIRETNKKLILSDKKNDLFQALRFYGSNVDSPDSISIMLEFPETFVNISEKLLATYDNDYITKKAISISSSNLSWGFLLQKKFELSLDAIKLSIKADSTFGLAYTNLPLAYLFNNQYSKAEEIYNKLKDKPLDPGNSTKKFREAFLEDIADLESKEITHPDFAKVKELLKK